MGKKVFWGEVLVVSILLLCTSMTATGQSPDESNEQQGTIISSSALDIAYIYNLTATLSNIVFTCYNESAGEIAKGRAFGTKGEHAAADILFDNMSLLGLHPVRERLEQRPGIPDDDLLTQLEVVNYSVTLNGRALDCFMAPSWKGPRGDEEQLNCSFSYQGLKVKILPSFPCLYHPSIAKETDDFVFLGIDQWNDPDGVMPGLDLLKPFLDPLKFYMLFHISSLIQIQRQTAAWYRMYPHCKGLLLSDFNAECHDMIYFLKDGTSLPVVFITGNDGAWIREHQEESRIDFSLTQQLNTSVESYNVIGEIKGSEPEKTVILSCLYDGWWSQSTADSAIGMAMVLGVAKYFVENHIQPKYTLKFVGFSGEEYDMRGAKYYEAAHPESIVAIIDLNQLGFTQETPRLTLDLVANHYRFLQQVWNVVEPMDYVERTGNVTDIKPIWWASGTIPGNALAFAEARPRCNAMSIFKDGGWVLHHRDGKNHTEGDVLSYFNWTDVEVTTELVTNLTISIVQGEFDAVDGLSESSLHLIDEHWSQERHVLVSRIIDLFI